MLERVRVNVQYVQMGSRWLERGVRVMCRWAPARRRHRQQMGCAAAPLCPALSTDDSRLFDSIPGTIPAPHMYSKHRFN